MLNDTLPTTESSKGEMIKVGDGQSFTGVLKSGSKVTTQYGECYKFLFEDIKGTTKVFFTKSDFLAGLLNHYDAGALIKISRTGTGPKTRWTVGEVEV